jgi:4-amino-4-deoxy-L-arabinose transferase-like glycosyltransferase
MPRDTLAARVPAVPLRWWPEMLLAALAGVVFLGCLGSVELWGKREQRASVEAMDTVEHNHWLVAQIQGRPRLEKPPLARWTIAALMIFTGRRDEWIVRVPCAVSALATVALVYAMGRRMGGRALGLASGLILCSLGLFVGEMRQASNDGPLALFTTLALHAAWRRFDEKDDCSRARDQQPSNGFGRSAPPARGWGLVFWCALGLGFLTKGPIMLLLVGVAVIPYLAFSRRLAWGLRRLFDGTGMLLFAGMALSWPCAVLMNDPSALRVWSLEMSEKTGLSHILEHRRHSLLVEQWPGMLLPWTLIAAVGVLLPVYLKAVNLRRRQAVGRDAGWPAPWFAWWWATGNLALFCLWAVAKPNYYVPCLPGMALLIGWAWVYLARAAHGQGLAAIFARALLQAQWVLLFVSAVSAPIVLRPWLPEALWPWTVAIALALATGVTFSAGAWRRGADALSLAPITAACALGVLIAYGIIAPEENPQRSHRALARRLEEIMSPGAQHTLMFFNEIDEGLWFYSRGFDLVPVPGSHPRYNAAYDLAERYLRERLPFETLLDLEAKRVAQEEQMLIDWLDRSAPRGSYVLLRSRLFDRYSRDLADRVIPVFRETGMKRNGVTLLVASRRASGKG